MSLGQNLQRVRDRIEAACVAAGRDPSTVTLVAVSKTVGIDGIREAYDHGLRVFGENRFQEAAPKVEALPKDIEWHFVGRLQSNKAKVVAETFQVVHTLENEGQLREIGKASRQIDGLVQLNLGNEPQKAGILPEALDKTLTLLLQCRNVRFQGLMTVGPLNPDPEGNRPLFRQMAELGRQVGAKWLSMGMSADLEVAIQEGSTHIRVGTAIFGERG